jgi:hypothetical protein
VRKLVTIGVCVVALLGTAMPVNAMDQQPIRAGRQTVGFGNRSGAPNYYCQPGVCKSTGIHDPDYRMWPWNRQRTVKSASQDR